MATMNLILDTRRAKKDGTYPLVFRLRHQEKYRDLNTGYSVKEKDFNLRTNSVRNNPLMNEQLEKIRSSYYTKMIVYIADNKHNEDVDDLKDYLTNKLTTEVTIHDFWQEEINEMKNVGRIGNASIHQTSLSVISKEVNLNIPFDKFAYKDLLILGNRLLKRGVSVNGLSVYLRSFRAICNKAIRLDYVSISWYPFKKYKIKKQKTTPRVLSIKEIQNYFALDLHEEHPLYKSWNIGKLIFLLRGINIIDLMLLTAKNIKRDRLIYQRAKTGKMYSIKITPIIQELLNNFASSDTLLGILSSEAFQNQDRKFENQGQRKKVLNDHLKKLGKMIDSVEPITTYVFRYTYANVAKQIGYSKDLIAEALGHEYGNSVTGIYLELFDLEKLDDMNDAIAKVVIE
jgi:integrase